MEIKTDSIIFPKARVINPQYQQRTYSFPKPVRDAAVGLTGVNFGFSPRQDRDFGVTNIRLDASWNGNLVTVEARFLVRDWSGEVDDDYEGNVQFVVIAELETTFVASNLSIAGVEHTQAIQFFRSKLDPGTAEPDNSIDLIAGKPTVMRVYVDTQNDPTRPTISSVSGILEFRLPGKPDWTPARLIRNFSPPKRDIDIDRGDFRDTLNFVIPGALDVENIDYRVRVFDVLFPDQAGYTSQRVQRTLRFTRVEPLKVRCIGINYTGLGLNLPAPDMAAIVKAFDRLRELYPTGDVLFTGFEVITYDGELNKPDGDTSGWNDLLNKLREIQGENDEVRYGVLPAELPTSGISGYGSGNGRVGAGKVNDVDLPAHEIGHAFGRNHAACNDTVTIPDENYPVYDALPRASIGEFGSSPFATIKNPKTTFDIMSPSSCGTRWISPYTYRALQQFFRPIAGLTDEQPLVFEGGEKILEPDPIQDEHLYLRFRIYRGGKIEVYPSFHYPSTPLPETGDRTSYGIELRDRNNTPLQSQRVLLADPYRDLDSSSLDFYTPIPLPKQATQLVFTCGEYGGCKQEVIHSVAIPTDPPRVKFLEPKTSGQLSGKVRVAWERVGGKEEPYYLLRYSNDEGKRWRAVAPGLQQKEYVVDLDKLPGGDKCLFQVLATELIRTGSAISVPFSVPHRKREAVIAAPADGAVIFTGQIVKFIGLAFSPSTGCAPAPEMSWHSDQDGALGVGRELITNTLRLGRHLISLRAPDGQGGQSSVSINIKVESPVGFSSVSSTRPDHD